MYDTSKEERIYLSVPYHEKDTVKKLGARWDPSMRSWFVQDKEKEKELQPWLKQRQDLSKEFQTYLEKKGFVITDKPRVDGETHRISVEGDVKNEQSGNYRAFGYPRPFISAHNYRTGETHQWRQNVQSESQTTDRQEPTHKNSQETQQLKEKGMKRAYFIWKKNKWAPKDMSYFKDKQVPGLYVKHIKDSVIVPGRNIHTNKIQTLQFISANGEKRFIKNAPKTGAMHVIDPEKKLSSAKDATIIVAEGYATAATLNLATRETTVCAFDSSNLKHVAQALREKFPDSKIILAADNDHSKGRNIGILRAKEAAKLVNGKMVFPSFSKEEKTKGLTDFNDLATSSGIHAVKKQLAQKLQQSRTKSVNQSL